MMSVFGQLFYVWEELGKRDINTNFTRRAQSMELRPKQAIHCLPSKSEQ
jgi:hypothetical protein